jgi:hypothetical protein
MFARLTMLAICLTAAQVQAQTAASDAATIEREWTDDSGKRQVRATLLAVDGATARFKRADGKIAHMSIKRLSAADRNVIAAWQAPELKPSFSNLGKSMTDVITAWPTKGLDASKSALERIDALREENAAPPPSNAVYVRVSQAFLQRRMARDVTRETKVDEEILGTQNVGVAHTTGRPTLRLLPSKDQGRAELFFTGHVHSKTVGYNGPVQIHSHSDTKFSSIARLTLLPDKLTAEPCTTQTSTDSTIDHITSSLPRLRGRIAVNIAWRRANEQLAEAEAIAARRAAARITREFDKAASERLSGLTEFARKQLANSQAALGTKDSAERPPTVQCSTTREYLQIVVVSPDAAPWADEPARLADRPDIEVHIHRRAMNAALAEARSQSTAVDSPPVLRYWLSRWATHVALPRIGEVLAGSDNETPRIDAQWSDDDEWLTLVWRQPAEETVIAARNEDRQAKAATRRVMASTAR